MKNFRIAIITKAALAVGAISLFAAPPADAGSCPTSSYSYGSYGHRGHSGYGHHYGGHSRSRSHVGFSYKYGSRGHHGFGIHIGKSYGHSNHHYGRSHHYSGRHSSRYYGNNHHSGYYVAHPKKSYDRGVGTYDNGGRVYRETRTTTTYNTGASYNTPKKTYVVDSSAQLDRAWNLLSDGENSRALRAFGSVASSDLDSGPPKVGYSLAAALAGDENTAVWAMRRAFSFDPNGLMYVPVDDSLTRKLERLAERYERRADKHHRADDFFMLASVYHFLGESDLARFAITEASGYGDNSLAARNLEALLPAPPAENSMYETENSAPSMYETETSAPNMYAPVQEEEVVEEDYESYDG